MKAAGGDLTAKQAPHRPGTAPALGLRAGCVVAPIVSQTPTAKKIPMWLRSLFNPLTLRSGFEKRRGPPARQRPRPGRLHIEPLEDRSLPSNYAFADLGTLGGLTSYANDINASGQIVGAAMTSAGDSHAYVWNNGTMIDLGTFGGRNSYAVAINDVG